MIFSYSSFFSIKHEDLKINFDQNKACSLDEYLFLTHAHTDHVCNTSQKTFATKETISLLENRYDYNKFNFIEMEYNKPYFLKDNFKVTALNAGHILGSSMFLFETENTSLLYTGDFNTKDSILLKGAKPVIADYLVIDSTFGREEFYFKERSLVYDELLKKIKQDLFENKFIILAGYSLGKNQEIIAFLNKYLNITPLVDKETYRYSKIYNSNNNNLNFILLDHNIYSSNVLVMPLSLMNRNLIKSLEHQIYKKISPYVLTGWKYSRGANLVNVSDHCDFNSLLDFINVVNPKKVFTIHGFTKDFANSINYKLGIEAQCVSSLNKKL
jgi:Cft2 family RNA processing exonuclease